MEILEKTTWFTNGSNKRKSIMKSKLNLPSEDQFEYDMLYDEEECIFDQEKSCLPALCKGRWVSRVDTDVASDALYERVRTYSKKFRTKQVDILIPPHTNQRFRILKF